MSALTANKLKIVTVLVAEELLAIETPNGKPRVVLRVKLPDRVLSADVAAKSVRKVQATIRELGGENVACLLQGALVANDVVVDAGLVAQPKVKKAAAAPG
jgi:hypothetical protein